MILEICIAIVCLAAGAGGDYYFRKPATKVVKEVSTIKTQDTQLLAKLVAWFESEPKKSENTLRREAKLMASDLRGLL
jgi:hypothetical protein